MNLSFVVYTSLLVGIHTPGISFAQPTGEGAMTSLDGQSNSAERPAIQYSRGIPLEASATTSANASIGDLNNDGHLDIVLAKGLTAVTIISA